MLPNKGEIMIFKTYKLNKQRKQIQIKELDTDKFERIGTTGSGYALKYNKGKTIYLSGEWTFDEMLKTQNMNDKAVENRHFSYARINENESSSKQNTLRDEKGRPIRIYETPKDYYLEIKHLRYINEEDMSKLWDEAHKRGIFIECYGCVWDIK